MLWHIHEEAHAPQFPPQECFPARLSFSSDLIQNATIRTSTPAAIKSPMAYAPFRLSFLAVTLTSLSSLVASVYSLKKSM